ncbi:hypothetical protein MOC70_00935 [Bacillus vallismortis]|uniref:hypothetical protein n=1 Tax=Bacillus vallismortis TaxID=72361 RepID=UPI002282AF7E|nr:hypothetical protein [Bacillus vallismortis]MCY8423224.1 hypothetical protein [Bacillus vallismortis]
MNKSKARRTSQSPSQGKPNQGERQYTEAASHTKPRLPHAHHPTLAAAFSRMLRPSHPL